MLMTINFQAADLLIKIDRSKTANNILVSNDFSTTPTNGIDGICKIVYSNLEGGGYKILLSSIEVLTKEGVYDFGKYSGTSYLSAIFDNGSIGANRGVYAHNYIAFVLKDVCIPSTASANTFITGSWIPNYKFNNTVTITLSTPTLVTGLSYTDWYSLYSGANSGYTIAAYDCSNTLKFKQ